MITVEAESPPDMVLLTDPGHELPCKEVDEGSAEGHVALACSLVIDEQCDRGRDTVPCDQIVQNGRYGYVRIRAVAVYFPVQYDQQRTGLTVP